MIISLSVAREFVGAAGVSDELLELLIDGVANAIEKYTNRKIESETGITEICSGGGNSLYLSFAPVILVTRVSDIVTGSNIDLDRITIFEGGGYIKYIDGSVFSSESYEVEYDAGYDTIPSAIRLAALTWLAEIYDNRAGNRSESLGDRSFDIGEIPDRVKAILTPYQRMYF